MRRTGLLFCGLCLLACGITADAGSAATSLWRDIKPDAIPLLGPRLITPVAARAFTLDYEALRRSLSTAPAEASRKTSTTLLSLPMPDGSTASFRVVETAVMSPALAAKFPGIHTYAGSAVNDPLTQGRFDIGPRGFHGMISSQRGVIYIDPFSRGDTAHYQSYFKKDSRRHGGLPGDKVIVPPKEKAAPRKSAARDSLIAKKGVNIAGELRTYRLALAADGEYSAFQDPEGAATLLGPDKAIVLAEQVVVVNRVTGIYEREVGIRLQLVDNNDAVIFTNALADPYIDDQGIAMLEVNTAVLDALIGPTNYDIGHVVSTGGGGVAGLGVVCSPIMKGAGVTGLSEPIGDGFYVDYVAHEMGHQFGGNHTFNSESGSCGGGNRNAGTAYEPGSGISIMAYAGICDADDIAPHSEDYFHAASFDEIVAYTREDAGNDCAAITTTTNHPPVADAGVGGFTIPRLTPFTLTGTGSDPDGDPITYQWEQFDLGAAGLAEEPDATAPLFRDFFPTTSPSRSFPQASDLLGKTHTIGELLPAVAREMNFRLTVRDNRTTALGTAAMPEAGGVGSADLKFNVADAGPFLVTSPNGAGPFKTGVAFDVRWDVAGTDVAPVSCATVDVLLSIDGGLSYPYTLATAQPNDGSQSVTLPANTATDTARVKVRCANSIFFDVSDADFKIVESAAVTPPPVTPPVTPPTTTPDAIPVVSPVPVAAVADSTGGSGRFGGSWSGAGSLLLALAALGRRRRA